MLSVPPLMVRLEEAGNSVLTLVARTPPPAMA
jgi:hypothetical protein